MEAVQAYYDAPTNDSQTGDEFVTPRTVGENPADTRIAEGDSVVYYNYRGDRPRELVRAFAQPDFYGNVPAVARLRREGLRPRRNAQACTSCA